MGQGMGLGNRQGEETDKGEPFQGIVSPNPQLAPLGRVYYPLFTGVSTEGS